MHATYGHTTMQPHLSHWPKRSPGELLIGAGMQDVRRVDQQAH